MTLEEIKIQSHGLRGGIAATLDDPTQKGFSQDDQQLIKFHGFYQQRNRDKNIPNGEKNISFMVRGRIPGGRLTAKQYLKWDELADTFGVGSLRITTRQTLQIHGVVKDNLRSLFQGIHSVNQTTAAACGDVVRNVTQPANPRGLAELELLNEPVNLLSNYFQYKTSAWTEIWIDGTKVDLPGEEEEPFYSSAYLPRKFKIAITVTGDNSVDLYTNDMGLAAEISNGAIQGYFVFAGGGMGMTHGKAETFPRLADLIGYIPADKIVAVAEAMISVHRDYSDRTNRKHARLKYVIAERGVEWFRNEVEKRQGFNFVQKQIPPWNTPRHLGWQPHTNGSWSLGIHLICGRITDNAHGRIKTALREIVQTYNPSVQVTTDLNLILQDIPATAKSAIEKILTSSGYEWKSPSPLFDRSIACVSLPSCPLALTEAEPVFLSILQKVEVLLEKYALQNRPLILRMTGCPNGCARPYVAELALIGQAANKFTIFAGGTASGDHLAQLLAQNIPLDAITDVFEKLFFIWQNEGKTEELLGDFIQRIGFETLKERLALG